MAAPSYWRTKEPAIEWFQTVPFGMNPEGMAAWYYQGDGLKLWEETYAPSTSCPPGPRLRPQMGGWFRKKINTIGDYKGSGCALAPASARSSPGGRHAVLTPPLRSTPPSSGA
jgi:TRAP-type mannitol/chloroaromatic compound transport system substrate-binding protein